MKMKYIMTVAVIGYIGMASSVSATIINNGSFETGDFSGWIIQDLAVPLTPLAVNLAGFDNGFFTTAPTDGLFAATHGFDGELGTIRIAQDLVITADQPIITFDFRAGWFNQGFEPRLLNVTVELPFGGPQIASYNIFSADPGTDNFDTGDMTGLVDLSLFSGQLVRVSFDTIIPETFTGPGFMQIDNIQAIPEPASLGLIGLVTGGLYFVRRFFPAV